MINSFFKILTIILVIILSVFVTLNFLKNIITDPFDKTARSPMVTVEIPQGKNLTQIAHDLKIKSLIRNVFGFKLLAKLTYDSATIKAGEYELSASMPPKEILRKLVSGDVVKRRVLVKEGANLWDIANALEDAGVVSKSDFINDATDPSFLRKAGINAPSLEGYLFPDTYFFSRPITSQEVIWQMFELAEKKWTAEFSNQLDILGMSRHDILTLASMIQKEAGNEEEMPIISSVFHNRIRTGMKMQSDPTVIYGIPNFNGNLTKADLEKDHPYNTYTRFGLPIGPIANPGEKAIRAALYPRVTNYFYFVADGKGGHAFSENLKDHNQAVFEYQIKPNA